MKSLNEIIAELEAFATAHWQIHTFGHGDVWEISPQSDGIVYPILWMVPQTATPSLNEVVDEFTILCMDLVDSGERNETDVLSDTRQIILDVCAFYRQTHTNSYTIEFGGSIEPFTERDPERVSGHSLTVRIKQPHDYNLCAVPANAVPVPAIPSCADATVQNAASNPTYQASVASGGVLILPQLKVLDTDGVTPILANYIPNTSGFAATCSPASPCADATFSIDGTQVDTVASGADLDVSVELDGSPVTPTYNSGTKVIGVTSPPAAASTTALPMKTGQTVSYQSGDDGDFEAGRATSFLVLAENNPFGNTNRFTDILGGQTYSDNIVIDWSTYEKSSGSVIMWSRVRQGITNWTSAVSAARALTYNGWTNWRLPTTKEGFSLFNYGVSTSPLNYAPFTTNAIDNVYWCGTTQPMNTAVGLAMAMSSWGMSGYNKVSSFRWIAARTGNISELSIP